MSVFAVLLFAVLAAVAIAAAIIARRAMRCAVDAAATALAAVGPHRSRFRVDASSSTPAPPAELLRCRNCSQLIEATPDGYSIPFVHFDTRAAACSVDSVSDPFVRWAEPALDRWLGDVEHVDLFPATDSTDVLAALPAPEVADGRPRCRNCLRPVEPSTFGRPWHHADGGPACWWIGEQYYPELSGLYAEPEPGDRSAIGSRPPLSLIPAPAAIAGGEL